MSIKVVPKVRAELTRDCRHRFLSLMPCLSINEHRYS